MAIPQPFGGTVELILNLQALPAGGPILMPSGEPAFIQANSSFKIACYPAPDEHHKRTALPVGQGFSARFPLYSGCFAGSREPRSRQPPSRDRATNREFIRDNLPEAIYLRCVVDAGVSVRTHNMGAAMSGIRDF
jgi:hypothetical protein